MTLTFIYPNFLWLLLLLPLTMFLSFLGRKGKQSSRTLLIVILRTCLLVGIIFALAGAQLRTKTDRLTTIFILDVSDSIPEIERSKGEKLIRQSIQSMPSGDRAAVILFGENALVERLASEERSPPEFASIPFSTRSNIFAAIQLAHANFPNEGAKRIVLLSDGMENIGHAIEQGRLAAANGIQILYLPLGKPDSETEVRFMELDAPKNISVGERMNLVASIHSSDPMEARIRVFINDVLYITRDIRLSKGINQFPIEIPAKRNGGDNFIRFRAQVIPAVDGWLQNNEAYAFTFVSGPPNILVIDGQPGESVNLVAALEASEMRIQLSSPENMPTRLEDLAGYQVIILNNLHATQLPSGSMDTLVAYVRDLGMGLLMIGGDKSFGAGGYIRTPIEEALPVSMDVRDKELNANLALVLAVDKSGSMGRCHCDNPNLTQSYSRIEVGQSKVDIAKEAIMRAAYALGGQDYLGVLAFDDQARWVLRVRSLPDPHTLEEAIGTFQAEGSTNLQAGVQAAFGALQDIPAKRKHIILMTDGWVHQGELTVLVEDLKNEGITLSVIAAGGGSAEYLSSLADSGGGRYYPATDILQVPNIFLKETVTSVGKYIVESPFIPLPTAAGTIFRGIDLSNLPLLLGYNGTTAKNTARRELLTPLGDPLLVTWQYGLGRSAAWTSDFKGQWGKDWISWEEFPRFASQLVGWLLPAPKGDGLEANVNIDGGQIVIQLNALDADGQPLNLLSGTATMISSGLNTNEVDLNQVGAGSYRGVAKLPEPGTYLIRLGVNHADKSFGQLLLGLVVPYSPEYETSEVDHGLLIHLAEITGGEVLNRPDAAFEHSLSAAPAVREIWHSLLLFSTLIFSIDIAVRRLVFLRADFIKIRKWFDKRFIRKSSPLAQQPAFLERLFEARQRALTEKHRQFDKSRRSPINLTSNDHSLLEQNSTDISPESSQEQVDDHISRLLEAKDRIRKKNSKS